MEPEPEPQQQPTYPQQYQQPYPQPYPYYYPPPPRKKEDRTILILVVALIIVFVVLPIVLSVILYWWVIGLTPEPPGWTDVPTGTWGQKDIVSSTAVDIDFGVIVPETRPSDLEIILTANLTRDGKYVFVTDWDGNLVHISGVNLGTLTYGDLADNQVVDSGDYIRLKGLTPNTNYTIRLIWSATGDTITSTTFSTPH